MTFTTIFKDELINLLSSKTKDICKSEEIEYSRGKYKIKFDGYILSEDKIIIIEIEFRRSDPISNLLKIIHWLRYYNSYKRIKMIHIFDNNYYSQKNNEYKKELTLFLAKRCHLLHRNLDRFIYKYLDIDVDKMSFRRNDESSAKKLASIVCKKLMKII
ncbi:MAG: hypothetical protein HYT35_01705 [Candidatus Staskawiczbacteria bacterium]|nr:hypothetical protein [Candidatus Staskawiczbacteria bacterium]